MDNTESTFTFRTQEDKNIFYKNQNLKQVEDNLLKLKNELTLLEVFNQDNLKDSLLKEIEQKKRQIIDLELNLSNLKTSIETSLDTTQTKDNNKSNL